MKYSTIIFILLMSLFSCKSVGVGDFQMDRLGTDRLPNLDVGINIQSLESAYSKGGINANGETNLAGIELGDVDIVVGGTTRQEVNDYNDKRIQDAITLFEMHANDHMSTGLGQPYGRAVYSIPIGESRRKGWGWTLLSSVTITVPNWFGMPFANGNSEVQVQLEILNCNEEVIARYRGIGRHKTPQAFYHGYEGDVFSQEIAGNAGMVRKSNIEAIKKALIEINDQIIMDRRTITTNLSPCSK